MNTKKLLAIILALVLILALSPTVVFAEEDYDNITLSIASAYDTSSVVVKAAEKFKEIVEEESGGAVKCNIIPGGSLGSSEDICEAVTVGGIEMAAMDFQVIYMYAPKYYFTDAPYVLKNYQHLLNVWDSHLGEEMRELCAAQNTILFRPFYRGNRIFTSNVPLNTVDDLSGIKLRLPVIDYWITIFSNLGAQPISIPLNDLYMSLETNAAEASEGPADQIRSYALYEVQDYLTLTNHCPVTALLTMNKAVYDGLNDKTRDLVDKAALESSEWATDWMIENENSIIEELGEKGMTIIEPDRESFEVAIAPTMEQLFKDYFDVTDYEEVMSLAP